MNEYTTEPVGKIYVDGEHVADILHFDPPEPQGSLSPPGERYDDGPPAIPHHKADKNMSRKERRARESIQRNEEKRRRRKTTK